jgi:hypothetical protein
MGIHKEGMGDNMNIFRLNDRLTLSIHCTSFYRTGLGKNAFNIVGTSTVKLLMFKKMLVIFGRFSYLPFQPLSSNRWMVCSSHFQEIYVQLLVIAFQNLRLKSNQQYKNCKRNTK